MQLLINLLSDIKICLAIALGSSFILGYLYTKFRAKEKYKPDFDQYKDMINTYHTESEEIKKQSNNIQLEIKDQKNQLEKKHSLSIKAHKILQKVGEQQKESKKQIQTTSILHDKKSKILKDYGKEIDTLKSNFELKYTTKIQELKHSLKSKLISTDATLQSKSKDFDTLRIKEKDQLKTNSDLNSKINSLKVVQNKKTLELSDAEDTLSALKSKLQDKFKALVKTKEDNLFLIEKYKQKLFDIKNNLA